jgi:hypothetical protein
VRERDPGVLWRVWAAGARIYCRPNRRLWISSILAGSFRSTITKTGADVHTESGEQDPLKQLERWGRRADRRARRARAARRLARTLTAPVRALFRPRRAGVIVVIVVVVVAALWFSRSLLGLSGSGVGRAYPTVSHPSGVFATSSATADPAGPFARTPAALWAEGEAGITLPPGAAVTDFAAEEVAADLATVKAALVAGRLDHKMLVDHDPSAFLDLLAPDARTDTGQQYRSRNMLGLVTSIDPDAHLDSRPPRVSGRMTFLSTMDDEHRTVLEIVTNYVWAYAFDTGHISLIHDEVHWRFYLDRDVLASSRGLWVFHYIGYWFNMDCDASHRGLLAPPRPYSGGGATSPDPENQDNYYDPNHTLEIGRGCASPTPG